MLRTQVLLSTYNGARFLLPQLESILQQEDADVSILIRDDGSHDNTVNIIEQQMKKHTNIRLIQGKNIGVVRSYFALIDAADSTAEFFALCDQDDIWLSHKLRTAASILSDYKGAALCASSAWITSDGYTIQGQTEVPRKPLTLANALVQNCLIGCTIAFNAATLDLLRAQPPDLTRVFMHDWWLYLVVSAFGTIVFQQTPTVMYRQHSANVVGLKSDSLRARTERFKRNRRDCSRQAMAFLDAYGPRLDADQRALVELLAEDKSLIRRMTLALSGSIYRQRRIDNLLLKLLLLLNHI